MIGAGMSHSAVARYFLMSRSTVSNIAKRSKQSLALQPKKRGRKIKLSERVLRKLMNYVKQNRFKSLSIIVAGYNAFAPVKISFNTLRRYLHKQGIKSCIAVSKPFLSTRNIRARILWANLHQNWSLSQWQNVVFSDESSFTARPTSLRKRVWRLSCQRYDTKYILPTFKSGYICISVWAAFSARGRTPLVRINGTLNQQKNRDILENSLFPFSLLKHGTLSNIVFQQDECGPHRAKSIKNFLDANNVAVME